MERGTPRDVAEVAIALARNETPPDRVIVRETPTATFPVTDNVAGRPASIRWEDVAVDGESHALARLAAVIDIEGPFSATPTRAFDREPDVEVTSDEVDLSVLEVSPGAIAWTQ